MFFRKQKTRRGPEGKHGKREMVWRRDVRGFSSSFSVVQTGNLHQIKGWEAHDIKREILS